MNKTRMRNHTTSRASEARPESPRTARTTCRAAAPRRHDRHGRGGCGYARRAAGILGSILAHGQPERGGGRDHVARSRDPEGRRDAGRSDQVPAGHEHAGDGAGRVGRVDGADARRRVAVTNEPRRRDQRQRRAHHRRRDQQHEKGARKTDRGQDAELVADPAMRRSIPGRESMQDRLGDERGDRNRDFRCREQPQRMRRAGGDPAGHEAADRQARHEPGEHGAGRVGGHTKDERQQPQPENLIGQACGAGAAQRAAGERGIERQCPIDGSPAASGPRPARSSPRIVSQWLDARPARARVQNLGPAEAGHYE